MANEVEYALMAGRVYQSTRASINWFPDLQSLGWVEFFPQQQSSGFEAIALQKDNEIVISFAGTGSAVDWWANAGGFFGVTSEQLEQAADYYLQVKAANPGAIISFAGHSLGGGLASLMAVFFGERATTFDQAPFRNSASVEVATILREYLLNQQGYSEADLQGLTNFISAAASGGIPNESNVIDFSLHGEILSAASGLRIGTPTSLTHGATDLTLAINLHSQALLTAFLQSDQTAPALHSFQDVTFKLPDAVRMIFDGNLYAFPTALNSNQENFLERLVRHQNGITGNPLTGELPVLADAMLTRFTSDLWKLAQDGGLTMTDNILGGILSSPPNDVSKALIAFAMQKYYDEQLAAGTTTTELFTDLTTAGLGSNDIHFDTEAVVGAGNAITGAKGYTLYFQNYLDSSAFSNNERQLIQPLLPTLRDWYVQAGANGMNVTDAQNRGAFMLGGSGTDTLTGGTQTDLLVGNAGADSFNGRGGNDVLLGGAGFDTYIYNSGDGTDQIEDASGQNAILFDRQLLQGGIRKSTDPSNTYTSPDGRFTYVQSGGDLIVNGSLILNENFQDGQFGIRLVNVSEPSYENGLPTRTDFTYMSNGVEVPYFSEFADTTYYGDGSTNDVIHALGGHDRVQTSLGNDQIYGEDDNDTLGGGDGHDRLIGGAGIDVLYGFDPYATAGGGNDRLEGGEGNDFLYGQGGADILLGGSGDDVLDADDIVNESWFVVSGSYNDYLEGGDGSDWLFGALGDDVLIGGADSDMLFGDADLAPSFRLSANDFLDGGDGDDELYGGRGADSLSGGGGADLLAGDYSLNGSEDGGADVLDGGTGDDQLFGVFGADVLSGGTGNDGLNGQDGSDVLYGGDGNDTLSGDLRISPATGTYDIAEYRDAGGNDLLNGGAGFDVLYGGEGDDMLAGGTENDTLYGEYNPTLFSPSDPLSTALQTLTGNDTLFGDDGNDALYGGNGTDSLYGGSGNDTLRGETGNDFLDGDDGVDSLDGGDGMDLVHGGTGNDYLRDFQGGDTLYGDEGDDVLISALEPLPSGEAATGDSTLIGGLGNDTYEIDSLGDIVMEAAGEGIDTVRSFVSYTLPDYVENLLGGGAVGIGNGLDNVMTGGETLEGLSGNDTLQGGLILNGGRGNDTLINGRHYLFALDDGHDTIQENDPIFNSAYLQNEDTLSFEAGVAPADVTWARTGNDLVLTINEGMDQITISSFYDLRLDRGGYFLTGAVFVPPQGSIFTPGGGLSAYVAPSRVEIVQFADGTVWHADHFGVPRLGDFRADTYNFGRGSGAVTVLDLDVTQSNIDREQDRIVIGADVLPNDVTVARVNGDDLVLSINGTSDRLRVQSFFTSITAIPPFSFSGYSVAAYRIERVEFTDGTLWTVSDVFNRLSTFVGTSGPDTLFGNQNDNLIQGLGGDDFLSGQAGDDVLDGGAGNDRVFGDAGNDTYVFGRGGGQDILVSIDGTGTDMDVVRLGADVLPSDVTIQVVSTSNDLVLRINGTTDQLLFDEFLWRSDYQIDQLVFGDGTVWDSAMILDRALGLTLTGTDAANTLRGSVLGDLLTGLGGNDTLIGNAGDDQLVGGSGDDILSGDEGDDTYVFNLGDGIDTIYDEVVPGDPNRVLYGPSITVGDLTVAQSGTTLTITVGSQGDSILLEDFDPLNQDGSLVVSTLEFADGSSVNLADLFPSNHAPTVATPLADQTVPEDAPFNLVVPSNTFADEDAGDVLTLSASLADGTALPAWLNFDAATRMFSGTPDDAQIGSLDLKVTATDHENLNVSDIFSLTVSNVHEAPTVAAPLPDQQATEDATFSVVVPAGTFADVDPGDVLTYSATLADGTSLPAWLSFDPITRAFTGTPDNADVGTLFFVVTAMDTGNLTGSTGFTLSVQNTNDAPAVLSPVADQTAAEDSAFTLTIPSTTFAEVDLIHGDILTYSATLADGSPLPAWLSFNPITRTLSGIPGAGDAGSLQIAVTATDTGNLIATDLFTLAISGPLPKTVIGTAGNDVLTGGRGDDTLTGLAGNDTLNGGQGHDLLNGGTGTDTMQGGTGNDIYVVDVAGDVVTELANEGTDTVQSSITYTLGANVENLTLTGTANLNGTGNALDNTLTGNSGINVLTGGAGNDTYLVGAGDTVVENFNGGTDTVVSAATWTLGSNVENLTLTGTANLNGTGNVLSNVLVGNSGANTLDGGAGNDTVDGGDGNDSLLGGSGEDQLLGGFGNDVLNAGSGHDVLNGGDGTDTLDGGAGDDQLLGGAGNDTLTGGSGADQFTGGTGNDSMVGGSGNDRYTFARGDGQDTISDTDPFPGNQDRAIFGDTINPLDLVISRQANDLRVTIHGSSDQITVQNWYVGTREQIETIQAGNGQTLLSTQVDQLIQAMAGFTQQTGLTWDQAIDQQPTQVQALLAASWQ